MDQKPPKPKRIKRKVELIDVHQDQTEEEILASVLSTVKKSPENSNLATVSAPPPVLKQQFKFLLIEDDPILNRLYKTKLQLEGQQVLDTMNGKTGLDMIRSEHPDFVLMDMNLPEMTGIEILQEIKNSGIITNVIVLTNNDDDKQRQQALALGAKDYLIKAATTPKQVFEKVLEVSRRDNS